MRVFIIISTLLFSLASTAQSVFHGRIILQDSLFPKDGRIIFPLINDTSKADLYNPINIDLSNPNHRIFYLIWPDWKSKVFRFIDGVCTDSVYSIKIPNDKFYKEFQQKEICPICFRSKYLIPIIYGLPGSKLMKQAKRNKVILAGCILYEDAPKFYCTKDNFQF
ncbi:hypothetical protein [Parafilimonas terrae]|uniref:Uncharacterized protein n=1 Tax=Parafilimonas terrae TaxID=1465490 RepID=A0A1I5WD12_9BACT|nr:hypothetical protein [Parafilimonas terrae]SFQ17629.1 hypothetical protein SAMN05444277_106107 [Parafilimonas terrae]